MTQRYQVTVSDQADEILKGLLRYGIYGRSIPEIIKRFVDAKLVTMVEIGANKRGKSIP
jgi:hypothetical protein